MTESNAVEKSPFNMTVKNVAVTTFEDDTIKPYEFDLYKGVANQTDRLGVLVPTHIPFARTHWQKELGYFLCHTDWKITGGQEVPVGALAPCCDRLGTPDKRFACLVIQYHTRPDGQVLEPFSYVLKLWRFTEEKYIQLRGLNKEFSLSKHDIKCQCTDAQYQKMTITPCNESIWRHEKFQKVYGPDLDQWIAASATKLERNIGRTYQLQEMLLKLGMGSGAPDIVVQDAAVSDIAELIK